MVEKPKQLEDSGEKTTTALPKQENLLKKPWQAPQISKLDTDKTEMLSGPGGDGGGGMFDSLS